MCTFLFQPERHPDKCAKLDDVHESLDKQHENASAAGIGAMHEARGGEFVHEHVHDREQGTATRNDQRHGEGAGFRFSTSVAFRRCPSGSA